MVGNIKELFETSVVLVKVGTFFEAYNSDAILLAYFFGYKLREVGLSDVSCGFPASALNKVKVGLEDRSIDYIIVDKVHNYEEIEKMTFKKKNKYEEIFKKANDRMNILKRIQDIYEALILDSSKLAEVEKIIYEG